MKKMKYFLIFDILTKESVKIMFDSLKSKKVLQGVVDYSQYKELKRKNILPMLISVSSDQQNDINCMTDLDSLYIKSGLTYTVFPKHDKILYTIDTDKLINSRILLGHFIHHDQKVSKIVRVVPSDSMMWDGGFELKKMGYCTLEELTREVVDPFEYDTNKAIK